MLEHKIARHLTDLREIDQYPNMQFFGIVSQFLDHGIDTTCEDHTCLDQFFEGWTGRQRRNTSLESGLETSLAYIAWRGEELRAHLQSPGEQPHHIALADLHGLFVGFGQHTGCTESQLFWRHL